MRKKDIFDMKVDEFGQPVLVQSRQTWLDTLFSAMAYPIRRMFSSKAERDNKDREVARFSSFLERIRIKPGKDSLTGQPTAVLFYEALTETERILKINYCIIKDDNKAKRKDYKVIEHKHGTIIYHIQNLTININAEVVSQLNTNPIQVINVIQDQLRATLEKMEEKKAPGKE